MDPRTWPLSAAATRRLLDLRADRQGLTPDKVLVQLTVKELMMRGALRVDQTVQKKRGKTVLMVSTQPAAQPLPAATALFAARLGTANARELGELLKATMRKDKRLVADLREAAYAELSSRGLAGPTDRKLLGLIKMRWWVLTPSGEAWQRQAREVVRRTDELAALPSPDPEAVDALGPAMLVAPGGLALGARAAARRRAGRGRAYDDSTSTGGMATPIPFLILPTDGAGDDGLLLDGAGGDPFSALDGLGDSLGGFLDDALSGLESSLDSGLDAIDGALGSIDSAISSIDSAVDSGVSDAGGSFDGGGDGGGGDGGGGGGD